MLIKGGHGQGNESIDYLVTERHLALAAPRIATKNTHGTGCSLSSAIAAGLAKGEDLETAVRNAKAWISAVPGDLRAIDIALSGPCVIAVEVVTRLRDIQSELRAAQLKQRDFGAKRLIIVVAGTHANRRVLGEAHGALEFAFDLDTQRVLRLLSAGKDPGRDAIIVLT